MSEQLQPLIGHERVADNLAKLVDAGRLPHAILLNGPKGIGKRLFAEWLACRLLCGAGLSGGLSFNEGAEIYPQIVARSTPRLHIIEPEDGKKSIAVAQVRGVLEKLSLASEGQRVVIIDAAEDMGVSTANALLKTLEEPGDGVHIVLVSHSLSKLLPTIISRCRQFKMHPLSDEQTGQIIGREAGDLDFEARLEVLGYADGCPGRVTPVLEAGGVELLGQVKALFEHGASVADGEAFVAKISQKRQVPLAMTVLQHYVVQNARKSADDGDVARASKLQKAYARISELQRDMLELNLTPALVFEEAVGAVLV